MIALRGVRKVYGRGETEVCALDEVSLDVPACHFVAVVGPSGSGKSTLLHLLGGLDQPSAGEIVIAGTPIAGMSDDDITIFRRRKIGFVFQFFNLLPSLTAEENVALPLLLDGRGRRAVQPAVEEALEQVGLARRRKHRPEELSGGEMQRVAIARALVGQPKLLLADEPTGNLDSAMAREILELLETINQQGTTIVMVTHDPELARRAGRQIHLLDGRLLDVTHETPRPLFHAAAGAAVVVS